MVEFPEIIDDIVLQEGSLAFGYIASGTVYAGQGVEIVNDMYVQAPTAQSTKCVGVCAYGVTTGKPVAVFGPANIVRCRVSGTAVTAGTRCQLYARGLFAATGANDDPSLIALQSQGTTRGIIKGMLI